MGFRFSMIGYAVDIGVLTVLIDDVSGGVIFGFSQYITMCS